MEFENAFSRPRKVMGFRENVGGHGKSWNFIFCSKYFVLLKTGNIFLVIEQKYTSKRLGFRHFLVMENSNWSWKIQIDQGKVSGCYCPVSVLILAQTLAKLLQ